MRNANVRRAPLSRRAALLRLNRKLADDNLIVQVALGGRRAALGHYYLVDLNNNSVRQTDVDLEKLARKVGAIQEWEEVR